MERNQAKEILERMSLEDCIKMWNESGADHYNRAAEIHEIEEDGWWTYLSNSLGAYYLMWYLLGSEEHFSRTDEFFFYCDSSCEFYSFSDKEEMLDILGEWFIEEIINRP